MQTNLLMMVLPEAIAAVLAQRRTADHVVEVLREEVCRFSVVTVARQADGTLDSFTALNLAESKIWHFIGHMVHLDDQAKVVVGAKFWEIFTTQAEAYNRKAQVIYLIWED